MFLHANGFATTAWSLVVLLPGRDESHPASPLATPREVSLLRCFARTDDAHRLLQYDYFRRAGMTAWTARPPLSGMPSGILVPARFFFTETRRACGPARSGIAPVPHLGRAPRSEDDPRWADRYPPARYPCTSCRAVRAGGGVEGPRAVQERRDPASTPSRERERFHTARGAFHLQESATPAGIAPIRLLRLASRSVRCPRLRGCGDERTGAHCGRALAFTLTGGGEIPARRPGGEDDVRPLRGPTKRP